ncbi:unnamed protein product [Camellia sinensis]
MRLFVGLHRWSWCVGKKDAACWFRRADPADELIFLTCLLDILLCDASTGVGYFPANKKTNSAKQKH